MTDWTQLSSDLERLLKLRSFVFGMVGRLFLILLLGMSVAAIGATMLASAKRQQEFERQNLNRIADRLQGFVNMTIRTGPAYPACR